MVAKSQAGGAGLRKFRRYSIRIEIDMMTISERLHKYDPILTLPLRECASVIFPTITDIVDLSVSSVSK